MIRKRGAPPRGGAAAGPNGRNSADQKNTQRSIEDRERAYAEARARIFGEETPASSGGETSNSATATAPAASPTADSKEGRAPAGSHQAAGPDGSRGFARGSRAPTGSVPSQQKSTGSCATSSPDSSSPSSSSSSSQPEGVHADQRTGFKPQQNWKESKVLWRNREQEMNDPDFTRNHDAYRPSRDSGNHAGGGYYHNNVPRYGGQQFHQPPPFDGSRGNVFGYQGGGQHQYPGRGRGLPSPEYQRIDRHPGSMAPPPGPYPASAFSPHRRGGAGFAPPPPPPPQSTPSQFARRAAADPSNRAYHDDFPPLGK
ncbi:hypothetical protein PINS_up001967 [Pythium insidiosum]|nr:hypothetical protein PINS_up001967 [Pythium insidiosum]